MRYTSLMAKAQPSTPVSRLLASQQGAACEYGCGAEHAYTVTYDAVVGADDSHVDSNGNAWLIYCSGPCGFYEQWSTADINANW